MPRDGDTLGISRSGAPQHAVKHLPKLPHNDIVQLAGAPRTDDTTENESPRLFAELRSRTARPLWAPLVVDQAAALKKSPEIDVALRRADSLDVAVLAIGGWSPGTSTVWPRVSEDLARAAARAGEVAEVSGLLLDESGHELDTPIAGMVVSASVAQVRSAHHRIGVASGAERAPAVLAAVRGGWRATSCATRPCVTRWNSFCAPVHRPARTEPPGAPTGTRRSRCRSAPDRHDRSPAVSSPSERTP